MERIKSFLNSVYEVEAMEVIPLKGYANVNYKIIDRHGKQFILKEYNPENDRLELIAAESSVLGLLDGKYPGAFPRTIPTTSSDNYCEFEISGDTIIYRLLSWIDGAFLSEVEHSDELLYSFGEFLAKMDVELMTVSNTTVKARHIEWDLQYVMDLQNRLSFVTDVETKKYIQYFLLQFRENVVPGLPFLRKSVIHNDGNDWNVLVTKGKVTGIIDFGDMVYAPLIDELAVAIPYMLFAVDNPIEKASGIIRGYNRVLPLQQIEVDLLYYLIAGRLCMSLLNSAYSKRNEPDNEYIAISEKGVKALLEKWVTINPKMAKNTFRKAAGFEPEQPTDISEALERRFVHISKVQSVSYKNPIRMSGASFQYMYDAYGNTFLDAYNNIPHVGHQHPGVVEAGQKQMAKLNTNTRYLYDQLPAYAEKLLSKFPAPLNKVFFVNSGSAASDLAIRMAQTFTGKQSIAVMEHGYHGHTRLGVDISHYKFGGKGGTGQKEFIYKAAIPDTFLGEFKDKDAGKKYASQLANSLKLAEGQIAAFIAEPIVGCGGQVPLPPGYLKEVYPIIRKEGGVCISDEVQTGFGRMGKHYWGFEAQEVVPDIVVLGKPMGNGHPIGAVVTTDEIAEAFDNGMEFFSSFGGNPVSCAIGMAVLDVIEEEKLQQNALEIGSYFMKLLLELQNEFPAIGDVRGSGLFLGVEFIKDPVTLEPNTELAQYIKNELRENFILVSTDGPYENVIKMKPPMCFNKDNASDVVDRLSEVLKIYYKQ